MKLYIKMILLSALFLNVVTYSAVIYVRNLTSNGGGVFVKIDDGTESGFSIVEGGDLEKVQDVMLRSSSAQTQDGKVVSRDINSVTWYDPLTQVFYQLNINLPGSVEEPSMLMILSNGEYLYQNKRYIITPAAPLQIPWSLFLP